MNAMEYVVNADELILLQSLLTYEYFQGVEPLRKNKYIQALNYSNANPLIHPPYSNQVSLEEQYEMNRVDLTPEQEMYELQSIKNPDITTQTVVGSNRNALWKPSTFPKHARELIMKGEIPATFYPVIYIVYKTTNVWHTVEEIRKKLAEAYTHYMEFYSEKVLDLWKKEGKFKTAMSVQRGEMTWQNAILSDNYGFSNLDFWVMSEVYNLPVVLFSSTSNKLANLGISQESDWVALNMSHPDGLMKNAQFFVRGTGPIHPRAIASFQLIKPAFLISEIKPFFRLVETALRNGEHTHLATLDHHLANYRVTEIIHISS
jgi:hypothetical protein